MMEDLSSFPEQFSFFAINFEITANTKNKWSRNQIGEIRWISTQPYVTPYGKTEKTTDVPLGKNSSLKMMEDLSSFPEQFSFFDFSLLM
jgi:hypothetical protein